MVSKQATEERLEKVRKLRELKKFGKKVQQEVNIKRAKEKREMLDQVKNENSVDFLYIFQLIQIKTINLIIIYRLKSLEKDKEEILTF